MQSSHDIVVAVDVQLFVAFEEYFAAAVLGQEDDVTDLDGDGTDLPATNRLDTQLDVVHLIRKLIYFDGVIKQLTTKQQRAQARKRLKFLIGVDRNSTESSDSVLKTQSSLDSSLKRA